MSLTDVTDTSQTDTLSFELELKHPPEKVWRALTDPELLQEWLLPVVSGAVDVGQAFVFQTQAFPGWDGRVDCEVIAAEKPHLLRYAWRVPFLDTVVTFMLTPTSSGTHLRLEQAGFKPEQKQNFGGARYGWKMMGQKLIDLLDRS